MDLYLKWLDSQGQEQERALREDEIVVGRKDADIVLGSPYVSRRHLKLVKNDAGYRLEDLNSSGGTYINGKRTAAQDLRPGDSIMLGRAAAELFYPEQEAHRTDSSPDATAQDHSDDPRPSRR